MNAQTKISFKRLNLNELNKIKGILIFFLNESESLDPFAERLNAITSGFVEDFRKSSKFSMLDDGSYLEFHLPTNLLVESIIVVKTPKDKNAKHVRKVGANLVDIVNERSATIHSQNLEFLIQIIFGYEIKNYRFEKYKSKKKKKGNSLNVLIRNPLKFKTKYHEFKAINEGIFFTRDLTNEPSNILTTIEFSRRLKSLKSLGLVIKILEEKNLKILGMNALLGVGQGSPSPSKVVIIEWKGGGKSRPLALVGKGVVFDTGGISIKPANGMEQMTVDMGGAGVVAGVMKTLALRNARANVIGIVGLVENMPDGNAQRPGDVVKSMKGDTIEIINTDAEGRLVLCDALWYVQKKYNPKAIIDLATLTGAIIVALGHEKAGVFSNNDSFANQFIECANNEDEGAWRMPLTEGYNGLLKSKVADIKNVGGRAANSITAAKFLERFVKEGIPWIHLDIAGVASTSTGTQFSPTGATGWGVRSLNRLIKDFFEL